MKTLDQERAEILGIPYERHNKRRGPDRGKADTKAQRKDDRSRSRAIKSKKRGDSVKDTYFRGKGSRSNSSERGYSKRGGDTRGLQKRTDMDEREFGKRADSLLTKRGK